jgi:glutamine amidotransferase
MLARCPDEATVAQHQGAAVMIAIIDYKAGNLTSVKKAFDHLGAETVVTSDPAQVAKANKIVLPGVGHFAATSALNDSGLRDAIVDSVERRVPFLGICVGMQWMLASSEEAPSVHGLALWPGECSRFPAEVKSPHVGWNSLQIRNDSSRLLRGIEPGSYVYFTHSYRVPLLASTSAECEYGGAFSAVVEKDNLFGVQFHPEKSGAAGLAILKNFCDL